MKLIYTHENGFLVNNVKNIVEANGIDVVLKNEYSSGAIGEISAIDAWVELWVIHDTEFDIAQHIVVNLQSKANDPEWQCRECSEENDASFDVCWNCQSENDEQMNV